MERHSKKHKKGRALILTVGALALVALSSYLGYQFINPREPQEQPPAADTAVITSTAPPTAVPEGTEVKRTLYVRGDDRVSLYEEANGGSDIIERLNRGTPVVYIGEENGYTKVSVNGKEGYIKSKNLSTQAEAPATQKPNKGLTQKTNPNKKITCRVVHESGTDIFLRNTPSEEGEIIGYIPNGTILDVSENGDEWTGVIYNGNFGYVKTKYITAEENTDNTMTVTNVNTAVSLREAPDEGYNDQTPTVPLGAQVEVISRDGDFYYVRYMGKTGYILAQYLK